MIWVGRLVGNLVDFGDRTGFVVLEFGYRGVTMVPLDVEALVC